MHFLTFLALGLYSTTVVARVGHDGHDDDDQGDDDDFYGTGAATSKGLEAEAEDPTSLPSRWSEHLRLCTTSQLPAGAPGPSASLGPRKHTG